MKCLLIGLALLLVGCTPVYVKSNDITQAEKDYAECKERAIAGSQQADAYTAIASMEGIMRNCMLSKGYRQQ